MTASTADFPKWVAKKEEALLVFSMGKSLRILAIFATNDEANTYMRSHEEAAVVAVFGPFIFLASKYDNGERLEGSLLAARSKEVKP